MNPEVLSRWLPILRHLHEKPNTSPGALAIEFDTTPASMFSVLANMRRHGYLKKPKKGDQGHLLTERAKKLLTTSA